MTRLVLLAAAVVALAGVASALAHAEPATAKPGDGAVLTTAPTRVDIEMSQDMARREGANDIRVFDAARNEITSAPAIIDNTDRKHISAGLPSPLAPGKYTVKWKTLSADDGDAAEGTLSFTFDPNGTPDPGKETLRQELLGTGATATKAAASGVPGAGGTAGVSWVLVVAVGIGMLVLGGGGAFLLVQKRA
jgi:methionine-rich copper-binding protein CopC